MNPLNVNPRTCATPAACRASPRVLDRDIGKGPCRRDRATRRRFGRARIPSRNACCAVCGETPPSGSGTAAASPIANMPSWPGTARNSSTITRPRSSVAMPSDMRRTTTGAGRWSTRECRCGRARSRSGSPPRPPCRHTSAAESRAIPARPDCGGGAACTARASGSGSGATRSAPDQHPADIAGCQLGVQPHVS